MVKFYISLESIAAGALIALAAGIYLTIGGWLGAMLFAIGLLTICYFQFELFTGKAGLLTTNDIGLRKISSIWCGNFIGTFIAATTINATSLGVKICEGATAIIENRLDNTWWETIILSIICGVLMYIAVNVYSTMPWVTVLCVMGFILFGAIHCIADMAYMWYSGFSIPAFMSVIGATIGNVVGCNLIPATKYPHIALT